MPRPAAELTGHIIQHSTRLALPCLMKFVCLVRVIRDEGGDPNAGRMVTVEGM